jgi:2-C-methyl-D-erythritol 4-phosphate cytidylyltransferase
MERFSVVVAGGTGTRMNSQIPKQFLSIGGRPVLMHTLEAFSRLSPAPFQVLVLPETDMERWAQLCEEFEFRLPHQVCPGGASRFESVRNGLAAIQSSEGLVAIHDGVRPFVSLQVLEESYQCAQQHGSAVTAVGLKDSVRQVLPDGSSQAMDRSLFRLIQTPQTFSLSLIREAFSKASHTQFTDDAAVVEAAGFPVKLIEGSYRNLKITTPEDLLVAEAFLQHAS